MTKLADIPLLRYPIFAATAAASRSFLSAYTWVTSARVAEQHLRGFQAVFVTHLGCKRVPQLVRVPVWNLRLFRSNTDGVRVSVRRVLVCGNELRTGFAAVLLR
jgi:hypothetical protein